MFEVKTLPSVTFCPFSSRVANILDVYISRTPRALTLHYCTLQDTNVMGNQMRKFRS